MSRVLVVDDKPENLYLLRALLQGHGYAVEEARHGAEALVKARQVPPDLIVSDLLMPVMDGYTLLRQWKADEALRTIPFVVYTATYTEPRDERLALDMGADAFILKPAEPDAFMARIREVVARAERGALASAQPAPADEKLVLKEYSEALVRKLEAKAAQLEETNRALREDVSRREQLEASLRTSEEAYHGLFDNAVFGVFRTSPEGRLVLANAATARILGYASPAELMASVTDVATDVHANPTRRQAFVDEVREHGAVAGFEAEIRRKGGPNGWAAVSARIVRDPAGRAIGYEGIIEDISERKQADAALRSKAEELAKATRHLEEAQAIARVGSWEFDPATGRSLWSAEMYRLFGCDPAADPPTVEFLELVHPDDRAAIAAAADARAGEPPVRVAFRTNPAQGAVRRFEATFSAVSRDGGIVLEGTTQDVTEHAALVERERRARGVAETLAEANLALAQEVELDAVLGTLLDHLARLVPYDSANVMLLEQGQRLAVRAARGYVGLTDANATERIVFEVGSNPLFQTIVTARAAVFVPDSLEEPAWQRVPGAEHVRSWLGIPLVQQGQLLGLFSLDKTEAGFFTQEHVGLAEALAPAGATAIANARFLGELREQEARLRLAIGASNLGPWDWDLRTNTVYFSAEWKRQIGYEDHEIQCQYQEWESRLHPEDREPTLAAVRAYLDGRRPEYDVEFRLRHKDGSYRWIYTRGETLRGADGTPYRMLGCHIDVTERKAAEAALRESRSSLASIYNTAADAIFHLAVEPDGQFRFVSVNSSFSRVTGVPEAAIVGKTVNEVIPEPSLSTVLVKYREAIATRGIVTWEETTQYPTGLLTGVVSVAPVLDDQGQCTHLVGSVHDITERRQAEDKLAAQLDELRRWHSAMLGRELRTLELKREVNELLAAAGQPPRYPSTEADTPQAHS